VSNHSVTVGRLGRPFGVKGFLKIHSFTDPFDNFLNYSPWFILFQGQSIEIISCELKGNFIIGQVTGCHTPEEAKKYVNTHIFIQRDQLPELESETHYLIDLLNFDIYNLKNQYLGKIEDFMETGANDVMIVKNKDKTLHIPYVLNHFIKKVDRENKQIIVDWEEDWL